MLRALLALVLSLAMGNPVLHWAASLGGNPNGSQTNTAGNWDPNGAQTDTRGNLDPNG